MQLVPRLCIKGLVIALMAAALPADATGQTRDELVRGDRDRWASDDQWYYDDLQEGIAAALEQNKPLMVVLRCIP